MPIQRGFVEANHVVQTAHQGHSQQRRRRERSNIGNSLRRSRAGAAAADRVHSGYDWVLVVYIDRNGRYPMQDELALRLVSMPLPKAMPVRPPDMRARAGVDTLMRL